MKKETIKRIGGRKHLLKYAKHFEKTDGENEVSGYLPCLIIWFRYLFDKAGIDDGQVPMLFGYDEDSDEAEDFWTWGHNSRYAHTFSNWVAADVDAAINVGLDLIEENKLGDFDPDILEELKQKERKKQ